MYRYLMIFVVYNMVIAMDLAPGLQERQSPRDVIVQMNDEHTGIEVNLDDDLNLDDHAHLIKHDYIKTIEGDRYYLTDKRRQKHAKEVLLDYRNNYSETYRLIQNRNASVRGSAGSPGVSNIHPVAAIQQEDSAAVPMDDIIKTAANDISHAIIRKDFTFLEHTITKEKTQKFVASIILGLVTVGLGILNGYLGNQTTSSC